MVGLSTGAYAETPLPPLVGADDLYFEERLDLREAVGTPLLIVQQSGPEEFLFETLPEWRTIPLEVILCIPHGYPVEERPQWERNMEAALALAFTGGEQSQRDLRMPLGKRLALAAAEARAVALAALAEGEPLQPPHTENLEVHGGTLEPAAATDAVEPFLKIVYPLSIIARVRRP